jgi:hypothetical protein
MTATRMARAVAEAPRPPELRGRLTVPQSGAGPPVRVHARTCAAPR